VTDRGERARDIGTERQRDRERRGRGRGGWGKEEWRPPCRQGRGGRDQHALRRPSPPGARRRAAPAPVRAFAGIPAALLSPVNTSCRCEGLGLMFARVDIRVDADARLPRVCARGVCAPGVRG
jgi:hypothetical protein